MLTEPEAAPARHIADPMHGWPAAGRRHPFRGCWSGWCRFPQTYPNPATPKIARRVAREESYEPALLRRMVTENLQSAQRLCNSKILRELLIHNIGAAEGWVRDPDLRQSDLDIANISTR